MAHKTHDDIQNEILALNDRIVVGETYSYYKYPENLYTVIAIATQEATDNLCGVYRGEYGGKLIFMRDVES